MQLTTPIEILPKPNTVVNVYGKDEKGYYTVLAQINRDNVWFVKNQKNHQWEVCNFSHEFIDWNY